MIAIAKPCRLIWLTLVVIALTGCGKYADDLFCGSGRCAFHDGEWERIAALANPGDPPGDRSNVYWNNEAAQQLGRKFFFDSGFSGNATQKDAINRKSPPARAAVDQPVGVSCATCHDLTHAGADTTPSPGYVSVGAGWTDVNALAVMNSAYRQVVFWNGRADSLWALNVVVAESATTMNGNRLALAHHIFDLYRAEYDAIFGPQWALDPAIGADPTRFPASGKPKPPGGADGVWEAMAGPDRNVINRVLVNWAKAIAAYEYKLIGVDSDFDRFVAAGPDSNLIPAAAKRGARLFVGKASCSSCHAGPQLTDELFHDIGVPQTGVAVPTTADCPATMPPADPKLAQCDCFSATALKCAPWGAYDGLRRLRDTTVGSPTRNRWLRTGDSSGDPAWSDDLADTSRQSYVDLPLTESLKGAWRTPSLRNVTLTAPYMHDGRYATLDDVLWHYDTAGHSAGPEQVGALAPEIKPLGLTDLEMADVVAFLGTLTGRPKYPDWMTPPTP
jgi:cytochrome c peroxidase